MPDNPFPASWEKETRPEASAAGTRKVLVYILQYSRHILAAATHPLGVVEALIHRSVDIVHREAPRVSSFATEGVGVRRKLVQVTIVERSSDLLFRARVQATLHVGSKKKREKYIIHATGLCTKYALHDKEESV